MSVLTELSAALRGGSVEVVDLTARLHSGTPILRLPEPFANTLGFELEEVSRYDDRGPRWYHNNIHTSEHSGTHVDAPVHWYSGKDGADIAGMPLGSMVGPAVVLDVSGKAAEDPDFLLTIEDVRAFEEEHGALPEGGWLLYRTGWDVRSGDTEEFLNTDENGSHTPGIDPECARYLAESPIAGVGVETVGTDAGRGFELDPPFPCHDLLLGAGKYGLTQLQNLSRLPATGAVVVVSPLPIVGGSGSPARALALVERA
ncbi:cyclase family protein [Sciscionella sediminilitoris]|uniref:cyclase family protein n=1 Tax=Sciscionella sediminilitoris TaxID=1445613 RepID=UPI0004DF9593|nr:cyclase family protein [Sciscionella sp. SE31]